jgi:ribosome-associated toxin RatA of RatAB toxin-antitoxin module
VTFLTAAGRTPSAACTAAGVVLSFAAALILPCHPARAGTPAWLAAAAAEAQLSAGQIVMRSELGSHEASAQAAVLVHASVQTVWRLITNCASVAAFVPGLKRCERLQSAPDGSWAIVEHDIRYSMLMPLIRSVVRSHYQPPYRVDFTGIGGNVKAESGSWVLEPAADGQATTVEYSISIEPGFFIPRSVVRHSLSKELPVMLTGLRDHAERVGAAAPARGAATLSLAAPQ